MGIRWPRDVRFFVLALARIDQGKYDGRMARELWVPADKLTVTTTAYTNGESAITVQGDFRRHTPVVPTGFGHAVDLPEPLGAITRLHEQPEA